jgi:hypothetical protein
MFQQDKPERSLFASQMYQMLSFSCLNFHPEGTSTSSEKINKHDVLKHVGLSNTKAA